MVKMYKQAILVRNDLKLPKGKLAAQVAHASVEAVMKSSKDNINPWRSEGQMKIVLKVADLDELMQFVRIANNSKIITSVITDAGKTVIAPGTTTCAALGPDEENKIDSVISSLKLL